MLFRSDNDQDAYRLVHSHGWSADDVADSYRRLAGLTLLLAFGLRPVLQLARVPPLRVMRRDLGALADGQPVSFEQALKMPTRAEAVARVVSLILSPASRLASQLKAPGANLASQIKSLSEGKETPAAAG